MFLSNMKGGGDIELKYWPPQKNLGLSLAHLVEKFWCRH